MAEVKISQLEQATTIDNNDIVPIVNEGETKKATIDAISQKVASNLQPVSYNADGLMTVAAKRKLDNIEDVEIIDDLVHTDTDKALSANQGKVLDGKITALTERVTKNEKTITYNAKRLDNLVKLTQGKVFDYQTDVTEAYTKTIPSGSQEYGALNMIGGKSLVFNQLLKNEKSSKTVSGVTITNNNDGSFTLNGTATASTRYELQESGFATIVSHKYYISSLNSKMSSSWGFMLFTHTGSFRNAEYERVNAGTNIDVCDSVSFRVIKDTTYNNDIIKPICIDLTQMFGEGNEPTLEQCREIFSDGYYPYNAGELMNFGVNAVETVGSNALDPNVRRETYTIPQNVLNLADYGASAGSVYNYIDFDRKVYVQNVESVDLGTLSWAERASGTNSTAYSAVVSPNYRILTPTYTTANMTSTYEYKGSTNAQYLSAHIDKMTRGVYSYKSTSASADNTIYVVAPKGSTPSGTLNYELATPIETDISDLIDNGLIFAEGNGTITFKNVHGNDYRVAVPNKETYMLKLSDAI